MLLDVSWVAAGVRALAGNILENGGGVSEELCVNDCSNLGNTDVGVSGCGRMGVVGVNGEAGAVIIDELERGCGDSKFDVCIESRVDAEAGVSGPSPWPCSPFCVGFTCAIWKRARGGSNPKTCNTERVNQDLGFMIAKKEVRAKISTYLLHLLGPTNVHYSLLFGQRLWERVNLGKAGLSILCIILHGG